jgi:hypothetical protein
MNMLRRFTVERAFLGFHGEGVLLLAPLRGGEPISASCPAAALPSRGSLVTSAEVRGWAAALSGAPEASQGAPRNLLASIGAPFPASRVLPGAPGGIEVEHRPIKTRDFPGEIGSQVGLTIPGVQEINTGDLPRGVDLG